MRCILIFLSLFGHFFAAASGEAAGEERYDQRIAIIGAGISGLSAAYYLERAGYHHIAVFEQEARLGGKIHSQEIAGELFEIGAVWVFKEYHTLLSLARDFGIPLQRYPGKKTVLAPDGRRAFLFDRAKAKYGLPALLAAYRRAKELLTRYPELRRPGLSGASPELFENFHDFAARHHIEAVAYLMQPFLIGCGYGDGETVPALYYMKVAVSLFDLLAKEFFAESLGAQTGAFQFFPGGYQALLARLAQKVDVYLQTKVTSIKRRGAGPIEINTDKGRFEFDKLIIASPPDATLQFLDASDEERLLFSQTEHTRFHVSAFTATGLPVHEAIFSDRAEDIRTAGAPAVIGNCLANNPICLALQPYDGRLGYLSNDYLAAKLDQGVGLLGGQMGDIIISEDFSYFFHYSSAKLQELQPHERLEALQGRRNTYYLGGLLNFEGVEHNAQYARDLVRRFFR